MGKQILIEVKTRKPPKSLSRNQITLLVLGSLLILLACQLFGRLGEQSPTSQSTSSSFNFPLAPKWQQELNCASVLPPQAWGEIVGVPAHYDLCPSQLYALDVKSGDILWQKPRDGFVTSPRSWLSQHDKLVVGGDDGVQTLDVRTGETVWSAPSFSTVRNVVYGEEKVFARVDRSTFRAYDLETGQVLWQSSVDVQSNIHYDARNKSLITVPSFIGGDFHWLDPASGRVLEPKKAKVQSLPKSGPVVEKGKLHYGALVIDATTAKLVCIHPEYNGNLDAGKTYYDLPLIDDVQYISTLWSVVAFDAIACQPSWEYQPQGGLGRRRPVVVSNSAVLNGVVYAIFSDATLRAIDQQNGQEVGYWQADAVKYSFRHNRAIPGVVASNDMLVASFGNGQLDAFGP